VSYNIQYGIGMDGRFDLERIVEAVRGADLIALQEVSRNNPKNGGVDMPGAIAALLPDYFHVFGAPFEADIGSAIENGRAVTRFFQFGNMILSRVPILAARTLLLPRMRTYDRLNLQRGALEAVIQTPFGAIRFYSVHLDHLSPDERIAQIRFLLERVHAYGLEGGAISGSREWGFPEPPTSEGFVLLGDFNMQPGSPEYCALTGRSDVEFARTARAGFALDTAVLAGEAGGHALTWFDPKRRDEPGRQRCLDYCFVHPVLAPLVRRHWIDQAAEGSDHRPVWVELSPA
jgi:endonuclease/exonuclease/phosphatase family metal-dependent hydrolase